MTTKIALTNIADTALATLTGPKVTTIVYPGDDTATDTAGGQTINLTGSGFQSGCSVLVGSTAASVVTFISSTQISFTAPVQTAGTYVLYVINPDGGTAISIPGISYSGTPTWTTTAGSLGTAYETGAISATLTATGDAPITYTLVSGTLPTGSSLNSNGTLSGTAVATASATTYSFTIKATDAQNQDTNRAFSITINPDVVTWSTPADSTTYSVFKDSAIANVTMSATSAAGGSITYTADTLPTGLSITGANIAGTPTVAASTTTTLTATATSTRSATRTINWVVTVANDTYFKNTTLLLNGETTVTPFISDASTNSFGLTINGDTKPVLFNPYTPGYYSNYFDGTGDYLSAPSNSAFAFGTGDFTLECWIYVSSPSDTPIYEGRTSGDSSLGFTLTAYSSTVIRIFCGSALISATVANYTNQWTHVAVVKNSGTTTLYVNGVSGGTTASLGNLTDAQPLIGAGRYTSSASPNAYMLGYISNFRIVKGTAVYTSAFTPNTTPLTSIANTSLLTCQSNRFIDNSTNAFTITVNGNTSISPNIPFTANASYSTYGSTYFDGTSDSLNLASAISLSGDFTIEAWVYPTAFPGTYHQIFNAPAFQFLIHSDGTLWLWNTLSHQTTVKLNTWTYVSIIRSGTSINLYVNGVKSTSTLTSLTTYVPQYIGSYGGSTEVFAGYISNFRVMTGTALYTATFTPPTTPLTAIANTSLLTCQYNGGATNQGIIDNSNFNNIITRNGNTSQGTFSPYSVTGFSNYFNGTSDYLSIPNNTAFNFGTGDATVEFWFNSPGSSNNYPTMIASVDYNASGSSRIGFDNTGYKNKIFVYINSGGDPVIASTSTIAYNTWAHIAIVRQGTSMKLYLNGILDTSVTISASLGWYLSNGGMRIGRGFDVDSSNAYFPGYLSNIRLVKGTAVYTSAFTPSTTPLTPITNTSLLTCQSNRFIDNSPNNFTLTPSGTPSVQALDPFGSVPEAVPISYSNFFDGTGDYLYSSASSANAMGTGDYTVEAWIYVTAAFGTTGSGRGAIISNRGQESAGAAFMLQHYNGKIYFGTSGTDVIVGSTTMVTNTWYHVVVSRSSGTVRLFLNGVSDATAVTGNSTNHSDTNAFYVGVDGAYDRYPFTGYISNARLVKGTAVYTSAFTPSTTPLTAIANTSLLTCQSTTFKDNSTNAFTITAVGNTVPRIFNPFGYTAQTYTSYTPSLHGGSAYFDGTGDFLTAPASTLWNFTGDWTWECWVYPTAITGFHTFLAQWGAPDNKFIWKMNSSGRMYLENLSTALTATSTTIVANQWQHIVLTRSSNTIRMFVNGVMDATTATRSGTYYSAGAMKISANDTGANESFIGYMSDMRILNGTSLYTSNFVPPTAPLTNYSTTNPASLLLNFNNGGIIDQHGTNVLETVGNAQLSTAIKKYGSASMSFDGTGDYLSIPNNALWALGTGDFTIEFWVYFNAFPSATWMVQLSQYVDTNNRVSIFFGNNATNENGLVFKVVTSSTVYKAVENDSASITMASLGYSTSTWYHVAITRSGSTIKGFINGTQKCTTTTSATFPTLAAPLLIGSFNTTPQLTHNGYVDDLRITKGVARYTSNFTAPTSALITK